MTTTPNLPPLPDDGYPGTMEEIHKIERARRPTIKIEPGSEMHMIGIMSQWHLNFVVGRDREHLVAYGQAAYQAGRKAGLSEGFDAGFAESGEGWNGEHPTNLQTYPAYQDNKKKALVSLESDTKGGV